MPHRSVSALAAALLLFGVAGCSDDSGGGGGSSATPTVSVTATPSASASVSGTAAPSASASASGTTSPSASPSVGASAPATAAAVVIRDFAFSPAELTVAPGAKITVTNQDGAAHTLTGAGSAGFDTGLLSRGQTKTITAPSTPGSYPFVCLPHSTTMKGTLTVR